MIHIVKVEEQKKNKSRVNLWTEEGFLTSLSLDSIIKYGIKDNCDISEEDIEKYRQEDSVKYAKERAMEYIAYAPRSRKQVRDKLKQKGLDAQSIKEALDTMEEYHYIDDAQYVREFVNVYKNKYGRNTIISKLRQNGVSQECIEEAMEFSEDDEYRLCLDTLETLLGRYDDVGDYKTRQKIYANLVRKGFSFELVKKAMNETLDGTDFD